MKCKGKCNSRRGKVAFSFTIKQLAIIPAKSDINTTADSRKEKVVIMSVSNSNKHLTLEERKIIEIGIGNDSTQAAIADTLGKNKSTISREIRSHRTLVKRSMFTVDCAKYQSCKPGNFCKGTNCKDFVAFKCKRRDRSPGACNGCSKFSNCRYTKYFYKAITAQAQYEHTLSDSRAGADLSTEEARVIAETVRPLLRKGQSPYHIIQNHPELGISERTLYNYIEDGVLEHFDIGPLDLRRQVSRKLPKKKKNEYKKRNDYKYLQGRKYADYLDFIALEPDTTIVQMDTVYNDGSCGPFIQTFKFLRYGFLFAVLHKTKDGESMVRGVDLLYSVLGPELFRREVGLILTDRGSEFTLADQFESDGHGSRRTRIFYCDPMSSCQKGSVENIHIELRYILPKETDLFALGLTSQKKLDLAVSHVDSSPKQSLNGKSPMDMLSFLAPDVYRKFLDFGLSHIEKDAVVLKPHLLK